MWQSQCPNSLQQQKKHRKSSRTRCHQGHTYPKWPTFSGHIHFLTILECPQTSPQYKVTHSTRVCVGTLIFQPYSTLGHMSLCSQLTVPHATRDSALGTMFITFFSHLGPLLFTQFSTSECSPREHHVYQDNATDTMYFNSQQLHFHSVFGVQRNNYFR